MNFDNVIGVSFNRRSEFMGDHLRLKTILDLNIQAESISSSNGDGFTGTQVKIVGLENQAFSGRTFYQNISINGISFGSGYVSNLTANPEGSDTQKKTYSATVTIISEGSLDEILPSIDKNSSKFIDSISESFSRQQESHRYTVTHTCSVRVNPLSKEVGKSLSEKILKGILSDNNNLNSIFDFSLEKAFSPKNYSYDEESQSYNFEETYEYVRNEFSDNECIIIQNNSTSYTNGIITININAEITGNGDGQDLQARGAAALNKADLFLNQQDDKGLFSYSALIPGNHSPIQFHPINKTLVFNKTEAKCSISIVYTNSQELQALAGDFVYWEYSNEEQKSTDENIYSEQGTIIGGNELISANETSGEEKKFQIADNFFKNKCSFSQVFQRIGDSNAKILSKSISRSYSEGIIRYSYTFSNNKSILYSGEDIDQIDRKRIDSKNIQKELNLFSTFLIPEYKELLQKQKNLKPELKIERSIININSKAKLNELISLINFNSILNSQELIIDSLIFRFSPKKREFESNLNYYQLRQ
jgi:hypothetical protein